MAVLDQLITDRFSVFNGDCVETMASLPDKSVHLSVYSPPFVGLYVYSSSERDLSNARSYDEFFLHYEFVVREIHRLTLPGRLSGVHVMDVPSSGANLGGDLIDFPGDVIRLHKRLGWNYVGRYHVWKEPLAVRNKTMMKSLAHQQIVEDSSLCDCASADYLLMFRKKGTNPIPITHPTGLTEYHGERPIPPELLPYRNWKGKQTENRYSHWIWRQYASAFWDDVRIGRVLPYKEARDSEDEKHLHPLQLDVIARCVTLWSNPGEVVLTPFMGVGSEVYEAVRMGRKAIGIELKPSYYRQAIRNLETVEEPVKQRSLFDLVESPVPEVEPPAGPDPAVSQNGKPDPGEDVAPSPPVVIDSQSGNPEVEPLPATKPAKPKRARKAKEGPSALADVARAMFPPPDEPPFARMPNATGDGCINLGRRPTPSGPLPDGSRIIWTDRDGSEWHGLYRFTIGDLSSITLDEVSPGVPLARCLRVDPATLRLEPAEMEVAS